MSQFINGKESLFYYVFKKRKERKALLKSYTKKSTLSSVNSSVDILAMCYIVSGSVEEITSKLIPATQV